MKLDILDIDRFIQENDVKEVTSTLFFTGNMAAENGLFDPNIFGFMPDEQKSLYGYIDLKDNYIHPLVVINLTRMGSLGSLLLQADSPKKKYAKVVDGRIIYVPKTDPDAETGKEFYWNNFDKINWTKSLSNLKITPEEESELDEEGLQELEQAMQDGMEDYSVTKQGRINFISGLTKNQFFTNKWLVVPVGFRNISSENRTLGSDINSEYRKLLTNINAISRFKSSSIIGLSNIQGYLIQSVILVNLFKDTIGWITGKRVDFDKSTNKPAPTTGVAKNSNLQEKIIGKNIDYSSRNVIIPPTIVNKDTYKDADAPAGFAGIPLATVCSSFMPFVQKYALDIIRELETEIERQTLKWEENFVRVEPVSKLYIEKLLKNFIKSERGRFDPFNFILIYEDDSGKQYKVEEILNLNYAHKQSDFKNGNYKVREFTITDLFYQAAVESIKDRYVLLARYPILNHLNIFPSGINLLSTKEEDRDIIILYNFNINWDDSKAPTSAMLQFKKYPKIPGFIDNNIERREPIQEKHTFINALIPGNTSLSSIGGDYDGDTLSIVGIFSEEGNKAAKEYINSAGYFVGANNKNMRSLGSVGKEFVMSLYELTRDER